MEKETGKGRKGNMHSTHKTPCAVRKHVALIAPNSSFPRVGQGEGRSMLGYKTAYGIKSLFASNYRIILVK